MIRSAAGPRSLVALLLVMILVGLVGCGPRGVEPVSPTDTSELEDTETEVDEETDESLNDQALALDAWQTPTNMKSIAASFARLEWRWATVEAGLEGESINVAYAYDGRETVAGEETDRITLTFGDEEWTIWLDADGNPKQAASSGDIIPGPMGQTMARAMLTMAVAPFTMVQAFPVRDVLMARRPEWSFDMVSSSNESFGDLSAEVSRFEVIARPPAVPEGTEFKMLWGVADFGDLQMLVEWRVLDGAEGDHAFIMEIVSIERR